MMDLLSSAADVLQTAPSLVPAPSSLTDAFVVAPFAGPPTIDFDYSSPVAQAFIKIAAIVLGACGILVVIAMGLCMTAISMKGFGDQRVLEFAGAALPWTIGGSIGLFSATGLAAWAANFQIFAA